MRFNSLFLRDSAFLLFLSIWLRSPMIYPALWLAYPRQDMPLSIVFIVANPIQAVLNLPLSMSKFGCRISVPSKKWKVRSLNFDQYILLFVPLQHEVRHMFRTKRDFGLYVNCTLRKLYGVLC